MKFQNLAAVIKLHLPAILVAVLIAAVIIPLLLMAIRTVKMNIEKKKKENNV